MGTKKKKENRPKSPHAEKKSPYSREQDHDLIWGRRSVLEALSGALTLQRIIIQENTTGTAITEIKQLSTQKGIPLETLSRSKMDDLVKGENHQGALAYIEPYRYYDLAEILEQAGSSQLPPLLLILDHIQDPQNLGSILRTAAAAGLNGVIIPRDRACGITPAVYKASAGNLVHVPIARVVNLGREMDRLKEQGYWIVGADMSGELPFDHTELPFPMALVLGSEGSGLSRLVREKCDLLLQIPMANDIMSLNVAVAGGIIIYHLYRQRSNGEKRGV